MSLVMFFIANQNDLNFFFLLVWFEYRDDKPHVSQFRFRSNNMKLHEPSLASNLGYVSLVITFSIAGLIGSSGFKSGRFLSMYIDQDAATHTITSSSSSIKIQT